MQTTRSDRLASLDAVSFDRRRRAWLLGCAGATLAQISACGGGGGMMGGQGNVPPFVDAGVGTNPPRALPIIALDAGTADGAGGRVFSLTAQRSRAQLLSGVSSNTMGYNGALLGPALRLRSGQQTTIRVHNQLSEATTAHWHGLIVPASMDGGPHQLIAAGATWEARFTVANPASTCWYHPHVHGATGRQVVAGLAGLLIVDDAAGPATNLPNAWGVDDLALVLQDKRFTAAGEIDYSLDTASPGAATRVSACWSTAPSRPNGKRPGSGCACACSTAATRASCRCAWAARCPGCKSPTRAACSPRRWRVRRWCWRRVSAPRCWWTSALWRRDRC